MAIIMNFGRDLDDGFNVDLYERCSTVAYPACKIVHEHVYISNDIRPSAQFVLG